MEQYKNKDLLVGKYRGVSLNAYDTCLSGRQGEIWETAPGLYKAFRITPAKQEKIFSFTSKELPRWILALEIPANPEEQLFWANNPNARYSDDL